MHAGACSGELAGDRADRALRPRGNPGPAIPDHAAVFVTVILRGALRARRAVEPRSDRMEARPPAITQPRSLGEERARHVTQARFRFPLHERWR